MLESAIRHPPPVRLLIWESPLVPVALAVTAGLVVDRYFDVPTTLFWIGLVMAGSLAVGCAALWPHRVVPCLWVACGCLAGLHHHTFRSAFPADDVGWLTTSEPRLMRLRGWLAEEPTPFRQPRPTPLTPYPQPEPSRSVLRVHEIENMGVWQPASGKILLVVDGPLADLHIGDEVEVLGWLQSPQGPINPGGFDWRAYLLDQRIRAVLRVRQTSATVVRLQEGWSRSVWGQLARVRAWGQQVCRQHLPDREAALAAALLLGETASLSSDEWEKYILTGVIHVLAISGQHLVVLSLFAGWSLRFLGVRRRPAALLIALLLLSYALLTGFRPPVQRAAVSSLITCWALFARRLPLPANTMALAWLVVIILNPTDIFQVGCQLSFLQVAVLIWGVARFQNTHGTEPLERLTEESLPMALRWVRAAVRYVALAYWVTTILCLVSLPLVVYRQHVVSLSGIVLGPPLIVLSSAALISGFVMLFLAPLGLGDCPAWLLQHALAMGELLVNWGVDWSWGHWYLPSPPVGWLWMIYGGFAVWLWSRPGRWHPSRWGVAATGAVAALFFPSYRSTSDELRITFLAVGHGCCTVVETPDGRVLLYDAGAMSGPETAKRHIAPFLWSRGYSRIDDIFLSHADLDHFNGVGELLKRFRVGRICHTPTFTKKPTPAVRSILAAMHRQGVKRHVVTAGQRFDAGSVLMEVLHPPAAGPDGPENVRSLVLRIEHQQHVILLTGDLEPPGSEHLVHQTRKAVDVLLAPHHGSTTASQLALARWANPRLVVVSGPATRSKRLDHVYSAALIWVTGDEGAITIRSHSTGLIGETFGSRKRIVIASGSQSVK